MANTVSFDEVGPSRSTANDTTSASLSAKDDEDRPPVTAQHSTMVESELAVPPVMMGPLGPR